MPRPFVKSHVPDGDDLNACLFQNNTAANQPAAGHLGMLFRTSDTGSFYFDNGTDLELVFASDGDPNIAGLRSLGTGTNQAAAGDHTHQPTNVNATTTTTDGDSGPATDEPYHVELTNSLVTYVEEDAPAFNGTNRTAVVTGHAALAVAADENDSRDYAVALYKASIQQVIVNDSVGADEANDVLIVWIDTAPQAGLDIELKAAASALNSGLHLLSAAVRIDVIGT